MPVAKIAFISIFGAVACASALSRSSGADDVIDQRDQPVRIALATAADRPLVGGSGTWRIYSGNSTRLVAKGNAGDAMRVETRGGQLVAVKTDGSVTTRYPAPFLVRSATDGAYVTFGGKRYRGELVITPNNGGGGLLVVNRLGVESYLRGVVPLEIGDRKPGEEAAVEAQAVAARSYI